MKTDLSRYVRFYQSISLDEDDAEAKERVIQNACDGGSLWYEQSTPKEWLFRWSDCLYAGELPDGTFRYSDPKADSLWAHFINPAVDQQRTIWRKPKEGQKRTALSH